MNHKWLLVVVMIAVAASLGTAVVRAHGPQPQGVTASLGSGFLYQGRLTNGGAPVNGSCDVAFRLFDDVAVGAQIGSVLTPSVAVVNGLFQTTLDFGQFAFNGQARWLEMRVRCPAGSGTYTTLAPRQALMPSPYALALPAFTTWLGSSAWSVIGNPVSNTLGAGVSGSVIGGGARNDVSSHYATVSGGYNNNASGYLATIGGGEGHQASGSSVTVGGGGLNVMTGTYGTIGGGYYNVGLADETTIGGGVNNVARADGATVGGGRTNTSGGVYATVAGGRNNQALDTHGFIGGGITNTIVITAGYAFIGGGRVNTAGDDYATIGGGDTNRATGSWSTVAGGSDNEASNTQAFVGGGEHNISSGNNSVVAGGNRNEATALGATIGGGDHNQALAIDATVAGGYGNIVSGTYGTIGGGHLITVTGYAATVPGGEYNLARGQYSFAAGVQANALHDGAFVWADNSAGAFASTLAKSFIVRAGGGVGLGTNAPQNQLHVVQSIADIATPENHVAQIENSANSNTADVLALKIGYTGIPVSSNNYVTFFKGDDSSAGSIEGNGSGGVVLAGAGNDYAEWLPRAERSERIEPGDLVGILDGRVSRRTAGATQILVASTGAIVAGNDPGKEQREAHTLVAFIGQAMVRVRGAVLSGDLIVPSGADDGVGIAIAPERITAEQYGQAVGQAWETNHDSGVKAVRVAVGLARQDPTVQRLVAYTQAQAETTEALEARVAALEQGAHGQSAALPIANWLSGNLLGLAALGVGLIAWRRGRRL